MKEDWGRGSIGEDVGVIISFSFLGTNGRMQPIVMAPKTSHQTLQNRRERHRKATEHQRRTLEDSRKTKNITECTIYRASLSTGGAGPRRAICEGEEGGGVGEPTPSGKAEARGAGNEGECSRHLNCSGVILADLTSMVSGKGPLALLTCEAAAQGVFGGFDLSSYRGVRVMPVWMAQEEATS